MIGPLTEQLPQILELLQAENAIEKLEYIFTEIAAGAGDHGDFLKLFAQSFNHADLANKGLLLMPAAALAIKYELLKQHLPADWKSQRAYSA